MQSSTGEAEWGARPPGAAPLFTAGHAGVIRFEEKALPSPRTTGGRLCKPATV